MNTGGDERVLVLIPTFNEAENIELIVARTRVAHPELDILVIEDNSPDGTGAIVDRLVAQDPRVHVVHRLVKDGIGAAYIAGFMWGLAQGFTVFIEMDADGSHQPEEIDRLLGAIGSAHIVQGSRWVSGGAVVNWPRHRLLLSRAGSLYARFALGIAIRDSTGGFRAYRREALESINLDTVSSKGYCFQIDMIRRALFEDLTVVEVPITFIEREFGTSKMSTRIVAEAMWRVTVWGAQRAFMRSRSALSQSH